MANVIKDPVRVIKTARKFTGKDKNRAALTRVKLDAGSAWSTDAYAMCRQAGVYEGEPMELPEIVVSRIAKMSARDNRSATVERDGNAVTVKLSGGATVEGELEGGTYPATENLERIMRNDPITTATVPVAQVLAVAKYQTETRILVDGNGGITFENNGDGGDTMPSVRFDGAAEGAPFDGVYNPKLLCNMLRGVAGTGKDAEATLEFGKRMMPMKARADGTEAVLMPANRPPKAEPKGDKELAKEVEAKAEDKAETKDKPEQEDHMGEAERKRIAEELYKEAVNRAANDVDSRVESVSLDHGARNMIGNMRGDRRLRAASYGEYTSWYLDDEFLCCIEERYSKRKIHLNYPPLKPRKHKEDMVAAFERRDAEKEARRMEEGQKAEEPKAEHEQVETEPEPKEVAMAAETATVTLEGVAGMFEGDDGVAVTQKREGCCIWVSGKTKEHHDELVSIGARWSKKRKAWYIRPEA